MEAYQILKELGAGKTSKVFQCQYKNDSDLQTNSENDVEKIETIKKECQTKNKQYALKKFKDYELSQKDINNEINAIQTFSHPNLLKLIEVDTTNKEKQYIVTELMPNGDLFDYVAQSNKKFDKNVAKFYFKQLIEGVQHMHKKNYCHRDLKLENCLLDEEYNLKICDFGFSCPNIKDSYEMERFLGTDGYMAPEICEQREYDGFQTDIFSLGVILFILNCGFPPYLKSATSKDPYYKYFVNGKQDVYWRNMKKKFNLDVDDNLIELINKMLEPEAEKRITLDEIIEHPYYKSKDELNESFDQQERKQYMEQLKIEMELSQL